MSTRQLLYEEHVSTPETESEIASSCDVYADASFLYVDTDPHEGCAMMTLACAVKVHKALGAAVTAVQASREDKLK